MFFFKYKDSEYNEKRLLISIYSSADAIDLDAASRDIMTVLIL